MLRNILLASAAAAARPAVLESAAAVWKQAPLSAHHWALLKRASPFSTRAALRAADGAADVAAEISVPGAASLKASSSADEAAAAAAARRGPPPPLPKFTPKPAKPYLKIKEALQYVKENAKAKFDETVDIALNLGVDPKRSDQVIRGMAVLPHGVGKTARVAVFAKGKDAEAALAAGADLVGAEDLIAEIKAGGSGAINFDRAIGHPAVMPLLSPIARVLGPRGLMPNPKLGTLTTDVASAVRLAKMGQVEFRADKTAILHAPIGKVSFEVNQLEENAQALIDAIVKAKPRTLKGLAATTGFITKASVSSTMGRGVTVSRDSVLEMSGFKK